MAPRNLPGTPVGLDIAPTGVAEAKALYPQLAERFHVGDFFDPPANMRDGFDVVLEHTCLSALPPGMRPEYRRGVDSTLRRGGLLVGVWFINPDLDPGEAGPPYPLSVEALTALFKDGYEIVDDYVPDVAFPGREGRERLRVLIKRHAHPRRGRLCCLRLNSLRRPSAATQTFGGKRQQGRSRVALGPLFPLRVGWVRRSSNGLLPG